MPIIRVYIDGSCPGCERAQRLVHELTAMYPDIDAATVDVEQYGEVPDSLFALPTWYVGARVWMLGNPSWTELQALLQEHAAG